MSRLLRIFFVGMLVSFLGTLPLGTLNVAAMQISISDGVRPAILFAIGALLIEMVYVRLSLVAMDWIRKQEKLFRALEWITLLIIVALAVSSFYAAAQPTAQKNIILSSTLPKFLLGIIMSAVNPVQIPFWFGWSTVLYTKKVLLPRPDIYNMYIGGIGIGTFIGNSIFIFGGRIVAERLTAGGNIIHWVIGSIFTITALIQLWRMLRHKDSAQKIHDIPEEKLHPERMADEHV